MILFILLFIILDDNFFTCLKIDKNEQKIKIFYVENFFLDIIFSNFLITNYPPTAFLASRNILFKSLFQKPFQGFSSYIFIDFQLYLLKLKYNLKLSLK